MAIPTFKGVPPEMVRNVWKELEKGLLYVDFTEVVPEWEDLTFEMFWKAQPTLVPNIRSIFLMEDNVALVDVQDVTGENMVAEYSKLQGKGIKFGGSTCTIAIVSAKDLERDYVAWVCELLLTGELEDKSINITFFQVNPEYKGTPIPITRPLSPTSSLILQVQSKVGKLSTKEIDQIVSELVAETNKRAIAESGEDKPKPKPLPIPLGKDGKPIAPISPGPDIVPPTSPHPDPHSTMISQDELGQSLLTASGALLKTMMEGGYLKKEPPKIKVYTGRKEDNHKCNFEQWEYSILAAQENHTDQAIKEAMRRQAEGEAGDTIRGLGTGASWKLMLETLRSKYQVVASFDSLMAKFYKVFKRNNQSVSEFATMIEGYLNNIRNKYPDRLNKEAYDSALRDRFFHGLPENLKNGIRYQYNNLTVPYSKLMEEARRIDEEEVKSEDKHSEAEVITKQKPKAKGSSTQAELDPLVRLERAQQASKNEMQNLQKKLGELTAALGNLQTAQPSSSQTSGNSNQHNNGGGRGRGGRGGYGRGRGYQGQGQQYHQQTYRPPGAPGGPRLCYWCRDFRPTAEADHLVTNCPHYTTARAEWWNHQSKYPKGSEVDGGSTHTHAQNNAQPKSQGNQGGSP